MKNLFYFLTLILFFASCKENIFEMESPKDRAGDLEVRGKTGDPFAGVVNTGRWLRFENQAHYDEVISKLEPLVGKPMDKGQQVILNDDTNGDGGDGGGGYGITYDEDPLIAILEEQIGIYTLRKKLLYEEDEILRAGKDPKAILKLDDLGFLPTGIRTLISAEGAIQIGDNIIIQVRDAVRFIVGENRADIANDILDNGPDAAFKEDHYGFVKIENKKGPTKSLSGGGTCTSDFDVAPGGYTDSQNQLAMRSFLWNLGDATMAENLNLTWSYGDGESEVTTISNANHTYRNLQPYPAVNSFSVCLTASYTYLDENDTEQNCVQSSCETIEIRLEQLEQNGEVDECKTLGRAFGGSWFLDLSLIEENPTPNEPSEVCVSLGNAALVLLNETISQDYTIEWDFQGQTDTGTQPCFYAACDGIYMINVKIKVGGVVCATLFNPYFHYVNANCDGKVDLVKKDELYYPLGGDTHKTLWWAKHETERDDSNFLGGIFNSAPNQVETKMKHYKKYGNNWFINFRHNRTTITGNIYPQGGACDCGGTPDFMTEVFEETFYRQNKFEKNHQVFESQQDRKGIFCQVDDPYVVGFYPLENTTVLDEEDVSFPQ